MTDFQNKHLREEWEKRQRAILAASSKRLAEDERDKLKSQLARMRASVSKGGEGGAGARAAPKDWRAQKEELEKRITELQQMQRRLDLALARANRERDTAEMERADKAQRQRRQELQELRLRMARQSMCRLEREQEERRRVFHEQFEQEREEFIQRGGAVADERRPTKAPEPSVSLSDAQPAPEPTDEKLDDFFAK